MTPPLTPQHLGQTLRQFRKSKSLSIREAAALAGVGERFLSELERGKSNAQLRLTLNTRDGTSR